MGEISPYLWTSIETSHRERRKPIKQCLPPPPTKGDLKGYLGSVPWYWKPMSGQGAIGWSYHSHPSSATGHQEIWIFFPASLQLPNFCQFLLQYHIWSCSVQFGKNYTAKGWTDVWAFLCIISFKLAIELERIKRVTSPYSLFVCLHFHQVRKWNGIGRNNFISLPKPN